MALKSSGEGMVDTTDEITAGNKFEILNKVTNETRGNQNSRSCWPWWSMRYYR